MLYLPLRTFKWRWIGAKAHDPATLGNPHQTKLKFEIQLQTIAYSD
jgi:hypothetical protein